MNFSYTEYVDRVLELAELPEVERQMYECWTPYRLQGVEEDEP